MVPIAKMKVGKYGSASNLEPPWDTFEPTESPIPRRVLIAGLALGRHDRDRVHACPGFMCSVALARTPRHAPMHPGSAALVLQVGVAAGPCARTAAGVCASPVIRPLDHCWQCWSPVRYHMHGGPSLGPDHGQTAAAIYS